MALGCAFIFIAFLYLWRRHARKQRAKATAAFASAKALNRKPNWRLRLRKLFGCSPAEVRPASEEIALWKLRAAEEARHNQELEKLIESYATGSPHESRLGELHDSESYPYRSHRLSGGGSIYSEVIGTPPRGPEPRQPVKTNPLTSRFSSTTLGSSVFKKPSLKRREPFSPKPQTDAEVYAECVRQTPQTSGGSLRVTNTGG